MNARSPQAIPGKLSYARSPASSSFTRRFERHFQGLAPPLRRQTKCYDSFPPSAVTCRLCTGRLSRTPVHEWKMTPNCRSEECVSERRYTFHHNMSTQSWRRQDILQSLQLGEFFFFIPCGYALSFSVSMFRRSTGNTSGHEAEEEG